MFKSKFAKFLGIASVLLTLLALAPAAQAAISTMSASNGTFTDRVEISFTRTSNSSLVYYGVYAEKFAGDTVACDSTHLVKEVASNTISQDAQGIFRIGVTSINPGVMLRFLVAELGSSHNVLSCGPANPDYGWRGPAAPPTNLSASDTLTNKVQITWTRSTTGDSGITYLVQRRTPAGSGTWQTQGITSSNTTFYDDASASPGVTYEYRAQAKSPGAEIYSSWSNTDTGIVPVAPLPAFDFSLTTGGNKAVVLYGQVTNTITANLISGTSQSVGSYSVTGLPTGAFYSVSPTTCNPTCTSTMTIYTAASTPPGQSSVTVRATGGGITRAASPFTLTVSAPSAGSYTISGSMGSGGTMGITGAQGASCTRSSSNYTCSNIPAGSSPTITPSRSGYTFSPTSRNFPSISSDKTGQNFTATASGGTGSIDSFIANPSSPTVNQSFLLDWATTGCASVTVGRMTPTQTIYLTRSTNVDGSTSVTETTTGTKTYEIDCLSSTASTATVLDQRTISVTVVGGGGGPIIIPEADCTAPATVGNWTEPVGTPPANNTFPPVTVSAVSQIKAGCVSLKALGIGLLGGVAPLYSLDIFGGAFIDGVMNVTGDLGVQGTIFGTVAPPVSDASLKTNISTLGGALAKILNLRGVSFDWIDGRQPGRQIGVVAQEVEKVYPEVVSTNNAGMKSVNYSALIAPLIEAVKEQQILINNLQSEVKQLKLEVSALRKQ